jgi:hypothetical protein
MARDNSSEGLSLIVTDPGPGVQRHLHLKYGMIFSELFFEFLKNSSLTGVPLPGI